MASPMSQQPIQDMPPPEGFKMPPRLDRVFRKRTVTGMMLWGACVVASIGGLTYIGFGNREKNKHFFAAKVHLGKKLRRQYAKLLLQDEYATSQLMDKLREEMKDVPNFSIDEPVYHFPKSFVEILATVREGSATKEELLLREQVLALMVEQVREQLARPKEL